MNISRAIRNIMYLFIILFMAACGQNSDTLEEIAVAKGLSGERTQMLDSYLLDFNSDLIALGLQPIDFTQTEMYISDDLTYQENKFNGICMIISKKNSGPARMYFDREYLNRVSDEKGRLLVYHEVGHCFFGLNHSEQDSIMSPSTTIRSEFFDTPEERQQYLKSMIVGH